MNDVRKKDMRGVICEQSKPVMSQIKKYLRRKKKPDRKKEQNRTKLRHEH